MREFQHLVIDIERQLEDAVRAKQQLDAERWRAELRPRALRLFAARARRLTWSRALLKAIVAELYPDGLFRDLAGSLDRVPLHRYPQVLAIAVALRVSWRRNGLKLLARRLRISLAPTRNERSTNRSRPSRSPFSGSPRRRQGSRFARPRRSQRGAHGLDRGLGRTRARTYVMGGKSRRSFEKGAR